MKTKPFICLIVLLISSCSSFVPKDEIEQKKYDMIQRIFDEPVNYNQIINSSSFTVRQPLLPEPTLVYDFENCCKEVKLRILLRDGIKPDYYCSSYYWVDIDRKTKQLWYEIIFLKEYEGYDVYLSFLWTFTDGEWVFSQFSSPEVPLCP